jgi:RNAse (barnase) inhibitor barstar
MRDRAGVFDQFTALLQFPRYFGENWDALFDMTQAEPLVANAVPTSRKTLTVSIDGAQSVHGKWL